MRRRASLSSSRGTVWPTAERLHVYEHQRVCIGPLAGMSGLCDIYDELDHVRASGAMGKKSKSIAVNGARLCNVHHDEKTLHGKTWRPALLHVIAVLHGRCERCIEQQLREYGIPFPSEHDSHVDPCGPECHAVPA